MAPWGSSGHMDFDKPTVNMQPIIKLITSSVAKETWRVIDERGRALHPDDDRAGAVGSVTPFYLNSSLIIRHTAEVHDQVANLLLLLRNYHYLVEPQECAGFPMQALSEPPAVPAAAEADVERRQALEIGPNAYDGS